MTDDTQAPAAQPATPPAPDPAPDPTPDPTPGPTPGPAPGPNNGPQLGPPPPWLQRWEIVAVLAVSLGASALYALLSFIGSLTAKQSLSHQTATLNGSLAPGRPLLDLFSQLLNITLSLAPVFLVFYLLARAGERPSSIGVDAREPGRDLARGRGPGQPGPDDPLDDRACAADRLVASRLVRVGGPGGAGIRICHTTRLRA